MLSKIAVIGLGTMGTSFARYALPLCDTVLVYDNRQEQMETLYSRMLNDDNPYDQYPAYVDIDTNKKKIKICPTLKELLINAPDLIIICTHKETNCEIALEAFSAGAHVLVEKPISCNLIEAKKMYEAAQSHQRFLFVEFCLHKYPEFEYLSSIVKKAEKTRPIRYQITRIAEIKDPTSLRITASFDLQVHDVDYCLQTFGVPTNIEKDILDPRHSRMRWTYPSGLQIDLLGQLPECHSIPFEYEFKCDFSDESSFAYSSSKNKNTRFLEKSSKEEVKEKIMLENSSAYQRILQEVVTVISSKKYLDVTTHPLLVSHAIAALELIE